MSKIFIVGGLLFAVVVVLGIALSAMKRKAGSAAKSSAYYLKKSLFSPAERSFLGVLEPVLPLGVRVYGKVGLDDVFGIVRGLTPADRQSARNRINRKHVDFLLVRGNDLAPLAGIELDDSSHDAEDRKQRDAFVDEVFKSASLPLLHVPAQKSYAPTEIRTKIATLLS